MNISNPFSGVRKGSWSILLGTNRLLESDGNSHIAIKENNTYNICSRFGKDARPPKYPQTTKLLPV
jgi:hypothetical protein